MSEALKERHFTFVGSTICYAYMQAIGLVTTISLTVFGAVHDEEGVKEQGAEIEPGVRLVARRGTALCAVPSRSTELLGKPEADVEVRARGRESRRRVGGGYPLRRSKPAGGG